MIKLFSMSEYNTINRKKSVKIKTKICDYRPLPLMDFDKT